ncbi:hypothetical protein BCR34DRAFT_309516 [Clohesyomyces aquaticus]|uniref:RapZ C-terminal domain-containing protein n=1 Tax=Clohesyomyces aquaticus TaxID=1231657 RepID=A0A1Y1ZQ82_9PLEO|nr:hypothetical protein BCR34DRAFT_309516 [Clohesyomyces aquaticus]
MSDLVQPILIIYSHGRSPPLDPPPELKYDLRSISNPPKALRDVSDGRSKPIREHLLSEPKFVTKLEAVERDIREAMESKIAEFTSKSKDEGAVPVEEQKDDHNEAQHIDVEDAESESEDIQGSENEVLLRVGCNCALGHHRSVAFVCELAQRPWPKAWHVEVVHRDLGTKRSGGARARQKASWKDRAKRRDTGDNSNLYDD